MRSRTFLRELLCEKPESLISQLFNVIDDYEIYCSLIGQEIELGESISSPIRDSDDNPSFTLFAPTRITTHREEEIWYKDLADGRFGNVLSFVRHFALNNYGELLQTKYDTIRFIDEQLELGILNGTPTKRERISRTFSKIEKKITYKSRPFTKRDREYWGQFNLTEDDLNKFNVKSVKYLVESNGIVRKEFKTKELVFVYQIWDKVKLYQPEASRSFKFRNTCPGDDYRYYQGFEQLAKKDVDTLIITKSFKDLMVFWKMYNVELGINVDVIAPHAESIKLSKEFVDGVKGQYKNIICVSDYDLAGVKFATQCKRYGFKYKFVCTNRVKINGKFKVLDKDISDFMANHGLQETKKLLSTWDLNTT
tara:strand:- start:486 stop:1583 length:1098 start_codon:yes stop_codon:yes gene_type:complete